MTSGNLLLVAVSLKDAQPLAILDFLHRLIDVFEDFLGSPLLMVKIQDNYEIVAQLLGEMCDGGVVCNTEPNSLRESVEVSSLIGKLFTQVGLSGYAFLFTQPLTFAERSEHLRLLVRRIPSPQVSVQPFHLRQGLPSLGESRMCDTHRTSFTSTLSKVCP